MRWPWQPNDGNAEQKEQHALAADVVIKRVDTLSNELRKTVDDLRDIADRLDRDAHNA